MGLIYAVASHVYTETPPSTYDMGVKMIDAILVSDGTYIKRVVYLPFWEGVGHHRSIYVDIQIEYVLGVKISTCIRAQTRRL